MSPPWTRVYSTSKRGIRDRDGHLFEASAEGKRDLGREEEGRKGDQRDNERGESP